MFIDATPENIYQLKWLELLKLLKVSKSEKVGKSRRLESEGKGGE